MVAKRILLTLSASGLLTISLAGCEGTRSTPPPHTAPPAGQTDVKVGPGGVDVEVGKDRRGGKKVDVEVGGGRGVNVEVDQKKP
ncbi:MAG: hypothetical protein K8T91_12345 [Planctomycetes bacterium]|nr:hypothetical protein [Planctomycetota bacterium]